MKPKLPQYIYPRLSDLPKKERLAFTLWLGDRTRPRVHFAPANDPQDFYFSWDYATWQRERVGPGFPRIRDLPVEEQAAFRKGLHGQTVPRVPGVPMKDQDFYFPCDYDRWKRGGGVWD